MTNQYDAIVRNPELTPTLGNSARGEIQILTDPAPDSAGVVYQDPYIRVVRDQVRFPSGKLGTYIRILLSSSRVGGVCIVPTWENSYVFIRQFRHAARSWQLEFPRGFAEPTASLSDNASRELLEELGASTTEMEFVGELYADSGLIGSSIGVFRADLSEPPQPIGDTGAAQLVLARAPEVRDLIKTGQIIDAISIAAFARVS